MEFFSLLVGDLEEKVIGECLYGHLPCALEAPTGFLEVVLTSMSFINSQSHMGLLRLNLSEVVRICSACFIKNST